MRPVEEGFRFLGQDIYPDRRLLPKSSVRRFMRRMRRFERMYSNREIGLDDIRQSLHSWLGHARQANTYTLRRELLDKIRFERKHLFFLGSFEYMMQLTIVIQLP